MSAHAGGVYIIAEIDISDRQRYGEYEAGFAPILVRYGGQVVGSRSIQSGRPRGSGRRSGARDVPTNEEPDN